jgi:hypothetical protein
VKRQIKPILPLGLSTKAKTIIDNKGTRQENTITRIFLVVSIRFQLSDFKTLLFSPTAGFSGSIGRGTFQNRISHGQAYICFLDRIGRLTSVRPHVR